MKKVLTAMSGGVDSSAAAYLLLQDGHAVSGATMKLFSNEDIGIGDKLKTCCSFEDVSDARNVCDILGVRHYVFNFAQDFKRHVIERFIESYRRGETPNPCLDCNSHMKLEKFMRRAEELEFSHIATGHYAKIEYDSGSGRYMLKRAKDRAKDQSYVLYMLTQEQMAKTLLPLGGYTKSEIREIASENGFVNSQKPDSQDICFVTDGDYAGFIESYRGTPMREGNFIDMSGNVLGRHKGIECYTIGQRKGLGISSVAPLYVCKKNAEANEVTLGGENELYPKAVTGRSLNLIAVQRLDMPIKAHVKTRYNGAEGEAVVHQLSDEEVYVEFTRPQRAPAPGQAVVFYDIDGDSVIGGAIIKDGM